MTRDTARRKTVGIGPACPYETERSDDRPPRPTLCQIGALKAAGEGAGEGPFRARRRPSRIKGQSPRPHLSTMKAGRRRVCVGVPPPHSTFATRCGWGSVRARALCRRGPGRAAKGWPPLRRPVSCEPNRNDEVSAVVSWPCERPRVRGDVSPLRRLPARVGAVA